MDIAALSSAMSKVMDQVEDTSAQLLEMLEAVAPSDLGQHIDIRV